MNRWPFIFIVLLLALASGCASGPKPVSKNTTLFDADNRLVTFKGPNMGTSQSVTVDVDGNLNELDTPTMARGMPTKIKRWKGFSVTNAI